MATSSRHDEEETEGGGTYNHRQQSLVVDGFRTVDRGGGGGGDHDDKNNEIRKPSSSALLRLQWYCAPDSWTSTGGGGSSGGDGGREGAAGSWSLAAEGAADGGTPTAATASSVSPPPPLTIIPPAKKDYWKRTYYEPVIAKDDGPFLYAAIDGYYPAAGDAGRPFYTVETKFSLTACCQFDQAGLMVRADSENWIKAGIEVVDGTPKLSAVVTRDGYSDWSTQRYPGKCRVGAAAETSAAKEGGGGGGGAKAAPAKKMKTSATNVVPASASVSEAAVVVVSDVEVRIHCRGDSFVVEAKSSEQQQQHEDGATNDSDRPAWEFIRIAHLKKPRAETTGSGGAEASPLLVGVFACCPEDQRGGRAVFSEFRIREGSDFEHNADGNIESGE